MQVGGVGGLASLAKKRLDEHTKLKTWLLHYLREKILKYWKKLKKVEKVEKWLKNHYLATLGIYFLKKLLRKYLQPHFLTDGPYMFKNVNTFRITYQKIS